jgi:hypothetical protein
VARTCPDGHTSQSEDYCDVCGLALEASPPAANEPDATAPDLGPVRPDTQLCPNCSAANPDDALFCEACGYDYTTGTMPRPVEQSIFTLPPPEPVAETVSEPAAEPTPSPQPAQPPGPTGGSAPELDTPWVAEVWIDPDWYHDQGSSDPMPSPGMPTVVVLRRSSSLVGRASRSRGISPEVDVSGDPGVSRRHAQLTTDGSRWFIEDLGSANGTYVGSATASLPSDPLPAGQKREIAAGEQVYLGAWTRIVIREAAEGEG